MEKAANWLTAIGISLVVSYIVVLAYDRNMLPGAKGAYE